MFVPLHTAPSNGVSLITGISLKNHVIAGVGEP